MKKCEELSADFIGGSEVKERQAYRMLDLLEQLPDDILDETLWENGSEYGERPDLGKTDRRNSRKKRWKHGVLTAACLGAVLAGSIFLSEVYQGALSDLNRTTEAAGTQGAIVSAGAQGGGTPTEAPHDGEGDGEFPAGDLPGFWYENMFYRWNEGGLADVLPDGARKVGILHWNEGETGPGENWQTTDRRLEGCQVYGYGPSDGKLFWVSTQEGYRLYILQGSEE